MNQSDDAVWWKTKNKKRILKETILNDHLSTIRLSCLLYVCISALCFFYGFASSPETKGKAILTVTKKVP